MFQVARSLGILDEVNRMKVVPGASPSSSLTNKNVRYMEVKALSAQSCSEMQDPGCVWFQSGLVPGWIWFHYVYLHNGVVSSESDLNDMDLLAVVLCGS